MRMLVLKCLLIECVLYNPYIIMLFVADTEQLVQVILGVLIRAILQISSTACTLAYFPFEPLQPSILV